MHPELHSELKHLLTFTNAEHNTTQEHNSALSKAYAVFGIDPKLYARHSLWSHAIKESKATGNVQAPRAQSSSSLDWRDNCCLESRMNWTRQNAMTLSIKQEWIMSVLWEDKEDENALIGLKGRGLSLHVDGLDLWII